MLSSGDVSLSSFLISKNFATLASGSASTADRYGAAAAGLSVDAMAMVYMAATLVWLLIALRFVNPTQLVSRVKEQPAH